MRISMGATVATVLLLSARKPILDCADIGLALQHEPAADHRRSRAANAFNAAFEESLRM